MILEVVTRAIADSIMISMIADRTSKIYAYDGYVVSAEDIGHTLLNCHLYSASLDLRGLLCADSQSLMYDISGILNHFDWDRKRLICFTPIHILLEYEKESN